MTLKNTPISKRLGKRPSSPDGCISYAERDRQPVPKLALGVAIAWFVQGFATPVLAASMAFGNGQIRFDKDTTLESTFLVSHGAYQSTFGVLNLDTNEKTPLLVEVKPSDEADTIFRPSSKTNNIDTLKDFRGTPGDTVPQPTAQFTFKANTNYAFYLESTYNGRPVGEVYSSDVLNPDQERQVSFSDDNMSALCQGGSVLSWDDTGAKLVRDREQQDRDYDDFVVQLRNTACPVGGGEPAAPAETVAASGGALPPAGGGRRLGGLLGLIPLGLLAALPGGSNKPSTKVGDDIVLPPGTRPDPPGKPVPEPFTILGSTTAIALGALAQRRRSKKRR
ncbi:PEP-CTERM sorting domain-containing protein [Myxacorys almedinensis]|uniref:PEP-CTERM sorting domain-containing protein n=1 Tax=Myxacorys almedinensis A TaxID=2690445 RepID=A0A8J8CMJ5_9CYAN|nr:PEP-CTERM sorting domain-containing protein [Myxacorys almedinensis]NDJ18755.1 PEP-CTERM sorting domain-containing protein [Myxacorys almedinensis A]